MAFSSIKELGEDILWKVVLLSGTINRHPAPWFNPVLENTVPELADKIAVINADAIINELHAKIK